MQHAYDRIARLEQQVRAWRTATLCIGGLAVLGGPLGAVLADRGAEAARLRSARPAEIATIDLPAMGKAAIVSDGLEYSAPKQEFDLTGGSRVEWTNGVKVHSATATIRLVGNPEQGPVRLFIEPKR